jgi:hypothetical protein
MPPLSTTRAIGIFSMATMMFEMLFYLFGILFNNRRLMKSTSFNRDI